MYSKTHYTRHKVYRPISRATLGYFKLPSAVGNLTVTTEALKPIRKQSYTSKNQSYLTEESDLVLDVF